MKWAGLALVLAAIGPLAGWLRRNPEQTPKIWMLVGFLPFAVTFFHLNIAIISWAYWPGYAKGMEFSVLDGLAIALYISTRSSLRSLPFRLWMALYFLAVLLSSFLAAVPIAAFFYDWQLLRVFLLYAVVARGCTDPRVPLAIIKGLAAGLFVEAGYAVWERFGQGVLQVTGTLGHQNLLGMMMHPVVLPSFALMLAEQGGWLIAAVVPIGALVDVLTTSRASVGLVSFGLVLIFFISATRKWTPRKAKVLSIGVALAVVISPLAVSSFSTRFSKEEQIFGTQAMMSGPHSRERPR